MVSRLEHRGLKGEDAMDVVKIMPCLDMKNGRVVKGIHFVDLKDAGDPVENAAFYQHEGADELAMLDIAATLENRKTRLEWVKGVASVIAIPLTVGGGISSLEDIELLLAAGVSKVSMNSAAVRRPELVSEAVGALYAHPGAALPTAGEACGLRPREYQRMRELHAFLGSGQGDHLSLDGIARHAGVNANTLQRQFRAVFGTTVFDHLRECRLQRARHALEHDGLTVGQAAVLAGYTSAANFATAYRRRFGMPPKLARARI